MEKKGSVTDLPFLITGIFTMAVTALLVSLLLWHINEKVQDNDIFEANAKSASEKMSDGFPRTMNGGIVFVFFAMSVISLVLASLVPIHPAFVVFYFLEWFLLIYVGGGIANAYQAIIENAAFAPIETYFTFSTLFFRYFPFVIGIVGALLAIVMYKARSTFWSRY